MKSKIRLETLLALLVLCSTVPLAVFGALLVKSTWYDQRDLVTSGSMETVRAVSNTVDQHVQSTIAALETLTALKIFEVNYVDGFSELATRVLGVQPNWKALLLANAKGEVIAHGGTSIAAARLASWATEVIEADKPSVSNLIIDEPNHRHVYVVAVPIRRNGRVPLVLAAEIDASFLADLLEKQVQAGSGVMALSDRNMVLMARTKDSARFVGHRGSEEFIAVTAGRNSGSFPNRMLDGTPAYTSYMRSDLTHWVVGVGLPKAEVDAPIRWLFWMLSLAGIGTLVVGVASASLLGRVVVRSTQASTAAAASLARGGPVAPGGSRIVELDELSRGLTEAGTTLNTRLAERDEAERRLAEAAEQRQHALQAERAARLESEEHEAHLNVTLRSIGDAVIVTDREGCVTTMNPVAERMTGFREAEALGHPIADICRIVDERTALPLESAVHRVMRDGQIAKLGSQSVLVSRTGANIPVADTAAPLIGPDDTVTGAVLVLRDVSVAREVERQRATLLAQEQTARREAEAISRSKDEFVATISHELRTPLNAILGWVRLLRGTSLDEAARGHALEVVERNSLAQAQLVEDLLEMSRIITGRLRPEMRRMDIGPVLDAALDTVRPSADAKTVALVVHVAPTLPHLLGDPERLQQVVWNLLTNAVKFTPPGGRVEVSVWQDADFIVIVIRDTGVGISPDQLPHVFDQFWQGGATERGSRAGLGIGLSLVKRLVDIHGGDVTAFSQGPRTGSTFTVRLPIPGEAEQAAAADAERAAIETPAADTPPLDGLSVLVVEDDADAAELVATVLQHAGSRVALLPNVLEALQWLDVHTPDLIISDVGLPDATGYELIRQVRTRPALRHVPAIALTAYGRPEDQAHALNAGFDVHVGKPFDPEVLVKRVVDLLRAQ